MSSNESSPRYPLNAAELRQEFDQVFAVSDVIRTHAIDDYLGIRVGTRSVVVRVVELTRIEFGGKIVTLPGGNPWLLGLTNSQGRLIPVYSLKLALGLDHSLGESNWLAICGRDEPIGFAFDLFEGYLRVPQSDVLGIGAHGSNTQHDQQTMRIGDELRLVVNTFSIIKSIQRKVDPSTYIKH